MDLYLCPLKGTDFENNLGYKGIKDKAGTE